MKELFYNNIWSDNKKISLAINILLFLVSINFMHIGQLFLPIICLLLFIDNKFRLQIKNKFIFILLCLFAISFFAFSFKQGFYSTMGFCIPMAYYIGSNIKEGINNEVKVIYIIAFGMAAHMILNMCMEVIVWSDNILHLLNKPSHYDIWLYVIGIVKRYDNILLNSKIRTTNTSMNYIFICSSIYYLLYIEKNKNIKASGIILFILSSLYCMILGRRSSILILCTSICVSVLIKLIKDRKLNKKNICYVFSIVILVICLLYFDVFGIETALKRIAIFNRLIDKGFNTDRLFIFINSIKLYPYHLWGNLGISNTLGYTPHDLWGDIYNYAGIIPFLLFLVYSIYCLVNIGKLLKEKINSDEMFLLLPLVICFSIILFVEPIMTGNSIFLICVVLLNAVLIKN